MPKSKIEHILEYEPEAESMYSVKKKLESCVEECISNPDSSSSKKLERNRRQLLVIDMLEQVKDIRKLYDPKLQKEYSEMFKKQHNLKREYKQLINDYVVGTVLSYMWMHIKEKYGIEEQNIPRRRHNLASGLGRYKFISGSTPMVGYDNSD